ncbi:MAG: hypothetical protein ACYCOU_02605 [Sulfobacillus sp.]
MIGPVTVNVPVRRCDFSDLRRPDFHRKISEEPSVAKVAYLVFAAIKGSPNYVSLVFASTGAYSEDKYQVDFSAKVPAVLSLVAEKFPSAKFKFVSYSLDHLSIGTEHAALIWNWKPGQVPVPSLLNRELLPAHRDSTAWANPSEEPEVSHGAPEIEKMPVLVRVAVCPEGERRRLLERAFERLEREHGARGLAYEEVVRMHVEEECERYNELRGVPKEHWLSLSQDDEGTAHVFRGKTFRFKNAEFSHYV